jgi:hypothetical protein
MLSGGLILECCATRFPCFRNWVGRMKLIECHKFFTAFHRMIRTTGSSVYASPCSHLKKTAAKLTRTFYQGGDIGETKYSSRASLCL